VTSDIDPELIRQKAEEFVWARFRGRYVASIDVDLENATPYYGTGGKPEGYIWTVTIYLDDSGEAVPSSLIFHPQGWYFAITDPLYNLAHPAPGSP
jgi:hypothetical protein